ncbi:MAG: peroxiredoxin [Solirubrobacterales bacterium]|jgi:peroxiredoxin
MSINVGDKIPEATFTRMGPEGPAPITTADVFGKKKVVLFSVPGAFTPTCSKKHLPGYVKEADAIKSKGVDTIACMAVNDVFVLDAWGKAAGAGDKVLMLADGNAEFTKKLGLEMDATKYGMGLRSKRFSMIVVDGVVKELNVEAPGEFNVSSAEATACQL